MRLRFIQYWLIALLTACVVLFGWVLVQSIRHVPYHEERRVECIVEYIGNGQYRIQAGSDVFIAQEEER